MSSRFYTVFVLSAWLASMSWLFVAKVWPTLHGGDPPDYSASVTNVEPNAPPTVWRISWKDRRIGRAANQTLLKAEGPSLRYVVQFEHMPLQMMVSEAFGVFGSMLFRDRHDTKPPGSQSDDPTSKAAGLGESPWELDMLLTTELQFNDRRQFTGFRTVGDLAQMPGLLHIEGKVDDFQKLHLSTQINAPFGQAAKELHQVIDLPPNAVVQDSFAPRPELKNLHVGQKWTIPVYRPFPPNSPVQIVAAHAERHELILWDGHDVETILVVYQADAGAGLNSTREPIAREWVRQDGLVLQQEVRWSGTVIRFERLADTTSDSVTEFLNDDLHPRLWK